MPWVMVPVPAEREEEFGEWLMTRMFQAKLGLWPDGAVKQACDHADRQLRAALVVTAQGTELWMPAAPVAEAGDLSVDDLVEQIAALNEYCDRQHWPPLVMVKTDEDVVGPPSYSLMMAGPVRPEVIAAAGDISR